MEANAKLLLRQLRDIQVQADKIVRGEHSSEAIENFARYSNELRGYILAKTDDAALCAQAEDLPVIRYERMNIRLWQLLVLPLGLLFFYKDYVRKTALVNEIGRAREQYARLERQAGQLS